ncbi:MAG: hypothetical protein GX811_05140 [Lentisphaerae bacterium]|nr:hypothetical protein [Lentisphaerota bacterium]
MSNFRYLLGILTISLITILPLLADPPPKQWDVTFGGDDADNLTSVCPTDDGGFVLVGYSKSGANGDKTEASRGNDDYWIVKIDSAGNKEWDKRYGGSGIDQAASVCQAHDGGFLVAGNSRSGADGDKTESSRGASDYWLIKLDSDGDLEWDRRFGGTSDDYATAVKATDDGGYVVAGFSDSNIGGDKSQNSHSSSYDYWVIKIDSDGNKEWDRRFGGTKADSARAIDLTADGGYIVGGESFSDDNGDKTETGRGGSDYWLIKLDSDGNLEWDKRFGGTGNDYAFSVCVTEDDEYLIAGYSYSDLNGDKSQAAQGNPDFWVVKTDNSGNKLWDRRFGGNEDNKAYSVMQASDGDILVAGSSNSQATGDKSEPRVGNHDFWIVKIDRDGDKVWDKRFGGLDPDVAYVIVQAQDNGFLVAGTSESGLNGDKSEASRGDKDYWAVKMIGAPTILLDLVSLNLPFGSPATFSVEANGTATLVYQWQHDNVDIAGANDPDLEILSVTWSNEGEYRCIVTNPAGSVTSLVANLTLEKAVPTLVTLPDTNPITYGETLSISTLSGGIASVPGSFVFVNPEFVPNAGDYSADILFVPDSHTDYVNVTTSVNVTVNKANQLIDFGAIPEQTLVDSYVLAATSSSGLPIVYSVIGPSLISEGNILSFNSTGTVSVTASQAGDSNWNPATDATQSFNVIFGTLDHLIPVYRLKSYGAPESTFEHLWTTSAAEKDILSSWPSWIYEGVAWFAYTNQVYGSVPLYRLYAQSVRQHHYTINEYEYQYLDGNGTWVGEGLQYYVFPTNIVEEMIPVYRFNHDDLALHHFTIDENEKDVIIQNPEWGYDYEGIGYFVFASDQTPKSFNEKTLSLGKKHEITVVDATPITEIIPVPGDYDGDGHDDNVVYETKTGLWYWLPEGYTGRFADIARDLTPLVQWGGPGFEPVTCDYDGDGISDFAVISMENKQLFVLSSNLEDVLAWEVEISE